MGTFTHTITLISASGDTRETVEALVAQMRQDVEQTRQILKESP